MVQAGHGPGVFVGAVEVEVVLGVGFHSGVELSVYFDGLDEGLAAAGTGVVGAVRADAAATEEEFATLGRFHRFRAGIAVLDAEDFGSTVRAFDGLATDRYCRIVDVNGFFR